MRRLFALAAILCCIAACGEGPRFTLIVQVVTDDDKPLADVPVTLEDGTQGTTDDLGQLRHRILGRDEGSRFSIKVEPPRGYAFVGKPEGAILLRHLLDLEGSSSKSLPLQYKVRLAPTTRKYAVLVRTNAPGIPVTVFGQQRAVTNAQGVAAFLYKGAPGEQLVVKLDTSANRRLMPANPSQSFLLGSKAQAFVVKEHFGQQAEPKRHVIRHIGPTRL